ncbi:MAG: transglycosylase SLT domain-containing protein [Aestuariivirga sp.]
MAARRGLHGVILFLAAIWIGLASVQAQVPIGDKPRQSQDGRTRADIEQTRTSAKRWLQYDENVTCGVFRDPARSPVDAMQRTEIVNLIRREAKAAGLREEFALSVAMQESRFSQNVRSCAGAIGVMQLMPGTAKQLGVDPYDLQDNIKGGVRYLRDQLVRFDGNETLAAAAYNAGPHRASLQAGRVPNIPETQTYVREIFGRWEPQFRVLVGSELGPTLAGANQNLVASARSASGSIGGTQALTASRNTAIAREGSYAGGQDRVQDAWEDNAQARVIAAQGFNRAIDQGATINLLQVAQLLHELAQTSQTARAMSYSANGPAASVPSWTPVRPPELPSSPQPLPPNPCTPSPTATSGTCSTAGRTADVTANVSSWLASVQASAPPTPPQP